MADGETMGSGPWASFNAVNSVEKAESSESSVGVRPARSCPGCAFGTICASRAQGPGPAGLEASTGEQRHPGPAGERDPAEKGLKAQLLSGSDGKESACSAGDLGSIPGWERSPGEGIGNPLLYSCLENPMDREAWRAMVHGVKKGWTQLSH